MTLDPEPLSQMTQDQAKPSGPDLEQGVTLAELAGGGKLVGHVGDEEILLVRRGMQSRTLARRH